MGLFDHFPYTNVHELNLDWMLRIMKALEAAWEQFTAGNSLTFADPLQHDMSKTYAKNTIVIDGSGNSYVSLQAVPVGVALGNQDYWLMVFDYEAFIEKVNKNFTARYYRGSYRATAAMAIGDWLTVDDVLCKATAAIAADDVLEVGVNIEHFTLEDFIKAFMHSANQLIEQYKNDIDASELAYRQQLADDVAATVADLQDQLDQAISGATVDSEVINARVGWDGVTYDTLRNALVTEFEDALEMTHNLASLSLYKATTFGNTFTASRNDQMINISGTSTTDAAVYITDEINIPAGTYYFGILNNSSNERVFAQLKEFQGGADVGFVDPNQANVQHMTTIVVSAPITVKIRLRVENGTRSGNFKFYLSTTNYQNMWNNIPPISAVDQIFRNIMNFTQMQQLASKYPTSDAPSTDFNNFTDPSWYMLQGAPNYSNGPTGVDTSNIPKSLLTVNPSGRGVVGSILQFLILNYGNSSIIYLRARLGGAWGNWTELYNKSSMNDAITKAFYNYLSSTHPATTDFDDFVDPGFYALQGAPDYSNKPIGALLANTPKSLLVYNPAGKGSNANGMIQILMVGYNYTHMNFYIRIRLGGAWGDWLLVYDGNMESFYKNVNISYTPSAQVSRGANVGSKVKIMSYNVAHYTMDNPYQDIPNAKIRNFINMLNEYDPDIICVQEDANYLDQNNTLESMDYLYYPQYPETVGTDECSIKSKAAPTEARRLQYSDGRKLTYCLFSIDSNILMVISTHPIGGTTQASIDARAIEYQELFDWIAGNITLEDIDTSEMVYSPPITHCIIGADMNSLENDDWTNILSIFGGSYTLGNNGRYGLLRTCRNVPSGWFSIDNIIISNNVIFNKMYSLSKDWEKLYSDHVPLLAEVTLT